MVSPPPSSDLGVEARSAESSHPTGSAEQVIMLCQEARRIKDLTPAFATVMTTHKSLILQALDRQVQLIRSRSQNLADGQVNIYDKALVSLTSFGDDLENPAGLLFWCEHYLAIDNVRGHVETPRIMDDMMTVPIVLNRAVEEMATNRLSGTTIKSEPGMSSQPRKSSEQEMSSEPVTSAEPIEFSAHSSDPSLRRLFGVYNTARVEYLNLVEEGGPKAVTAARFLRDTAENTLTYVKGMTIDADGLAELKETCEMATKAVVTLKGGKKRKFADLEGEDEGEPIESGMADEKARDGGIKDRDDGRRAKRARDDGGRRRGGRGRGRGPRGGRGSGRGPSGIPFGYTRPVDSYYPH